MMVIGHGFLAKRFESYQNNDRFIIFASGVSNSKNTQDSDYDRERELLSSTIKNNKTKILVYFSTCSIYDPDEKRSKYVLHKLKMEKLIQKEISQFNIFRVSNLAGKSDNPNTVLNFFNFHISNKINFDLWSNAERNLLDIDDMYKIIDYILQGRLFLNEVTNIANPVSYKAKEIIHCIEKFRGIKSNHIPIGKGSSFKIDISTIRPIIQELDIHFGGDYLINLLKKYYHP